MDSPKKQPIPAGPGPGAITPEAAAARRTTDPIDDDDLVAQREKQVVRKLDIYVIPLVMLLYLFSFLDR